MRCPLCKYLVGYNSDTRKDEEPEEGDFYKLPIQMERNEYGRYPLERTTVYACPKCKQLFIEGV
jgi:hypothetical protein